MSVKTNAMRRLDELGIFYQTREYQVDSDDLTAESVAVKIQLPAEQVFKTLVVRGERNGPAFAIIPGDAELNLKALAKLAGERKMELIPLKEVQPLTGYVRGGVTVLAAKKEFPVFLDETAILFDLISVSAGVRGMQMLLHPDEYARAVNANYGGISTKDLS